MKQWSYIEILKTDLNKLLQNFKSLNMQQLIGLFNILERESGYHYSGLE